MPARRTFLSMLAAGLVPAPGATGNHMGLEIYSLRGKAANDLPATLRTVRGLGFREVEVSELYGATAFEYRRQLDAHGLKATSMMAGFDELTKDCGKVARDAETLSVEYVVCSTIPHKDKYLSVEDCGPAALQLNAWGKRLQESGVHCCYHTHGTEFHAFENGTVFDALAKLMDPEYANFEMDIFWIVYGLQDPVKMLHRYPGRFPLMHVKDIRKGTKLGGVPADVREEESVPLGQGIVNLRTVLQAAKQTGVKHYYIEDEAVDAEAQLPVSLTYLKRLGF